jgi:hypothetical protein
MPFNPDVNRSRYSLNPSPNEDNNPIIYVSRTQPYPLYGQPYTQQELDDINSRQSFLDHNETNKAGESQSLLRGIEKIFDRSQFNMTGRQEFRFLQCPDGTGKVYEAILLTLMLISCRNFFGECRVDVWLNAVLYLKRIETLYRTNANYNGPGSPHHLRFAHGYFSGVLDGRLRYRDANWAGTYHSQTFYIVDRVFPQLDLAFA